MLKALLLVALVTSCAHHRGLEPACPAFKEGWIECSEHDACLCWRCDAARLVWERVEVC